MNVSRELPEVEFELQASNIQEHQVTLKETVHTTQEDLTRVL